MTSLDTRLLVSLPAWNAIASMADMTPEEAGQFADGIDRLQALVRERGARGMSAQQAVAAGLLTRAEFDAAFEIELPQEVD